MLFSKMLVLKNDLTCGSSVTLKTESGVKDPNSVEHGVCSLVTSLLTKKSTEQKHTERERKNTMQEHFFQQIPAATGSRPFCGRHCRYFLGIIIRCALVLNASGWDGEHFRCTQPVRACKASKWAALFGSALCAALVHKLWFKPHNPARLMWDYYGPDPAARRRTDGQTEPLRGAVGFVWRDVCVCWLWQRSRSCHSRRHL